MQKRALTVAALCASFAAAIPGAAAAQEASARTAADDVVLHSSDELHWQATEFKGVQVAVLWGDPESESRGGELLKVESGLAFPEHAHRYDERVLVISGSFVFILPSVLNWRSADKTVRCSRRFHRRS
jgi:hypothetical protein